MTDKGIEKILGQVDPDGLILLKEIYFVGVDRAAEVLQAFGLEDNAENAEDRRDEIK